MKRTVLCLALAILTGCSPAPDAPLAPEATGGAEPGASEAPRADPGEPDTDRPEPQPNASEREATNEPASPMARAFVAAHAARREAHCAGPLAWSDELARVAQAWADGIAARGCALEHSRGPYGENLAAGSAGTLSPEAVVEMWYGESSRYRYRNARFSMQTGHFTQVVWASSARLGCGATSCNGMDVFVCNYDPAGNVAGEFEDNVRPTSCR